MELKKCPIIYQYTGNYLDALYSVNGIFIYHSAQREHNYWFDNIPVFFDNFDEAMFKYNDMVRISKHKWKKSITPQ